MFKPSRCSNISIFLISQDYYEHSKNNFRGNGDIYQIFEPKKFRDVQSLYQDKATMKMRLTEVKLLTSSCWNEKYQTLIIDMTKGKHTRRHRLGLNFMFVPDCSPFQ